MQEEPSGIRLLQLIEGKITQITRRERENLAHICLYETGGYWAAFERSAYQLCRLFPDLNVSALKLRDNPFPVVFACVSDKELLSYAESHILCVDKPDYKEILAEEISPVNYFRWHQQSLQPLVTARPALHQKSDYYT